MIKNDLKMTIKKKQKFQVQYIKITKIQPLYKFQQKLNKSYIHTFLKNNTYSSMSNIYKKMTKNHHKKQSKNSQKIGQK
jgi:hypothetical protein